MMEPEKGTESRLEADLGQLAIARLGLEEFELLVAHRRGGKIRGKRRDGSVEVAHDRIVVAPRILDGVFYGSELRLEIAESARRLELRIRFGSDDETAKRGRELALGLRALGGSAALCGDSSRSGLGHRVESLALVSGVALHGVDEIGNEISAPFQLNVNVRPCVFGADAEGDESIVQTDECKNYNDKDDQKDDECHRGGLEWLENGSLKLPGQYIIERSCPLVAHSALAVSAASLGIKRWTQFTIASRITS